MLLNMKTRAARRVPAVGRRRLFASEAEVDGGDVTDLLPEASKGAAVGVPKHGDIAQHALHHLVRVREAELRQVDRHREETEP